MQGLSCGESHGRMHVNDQNIVLVLLRRQQVFRQQHRCALRRGAVQLGREIDVSALRL